MALDVFIGFLVGGMILIVCIGFGIAVMYLVATLLGGGD